MRGLQLMEMIKLKQLRYTLIGAVKVYNEGVLEYHGHYSGIPITLDEQRVLRIASTGAYTTTIDVTAWGKDKQV